MESPLTFVLLLALIWLAIWVMVERAARRRIEDSIPDMVKDAIKDHKRRSARTRVGNTVEHFAPFLEQFPYDPSDARFISGGPIDYVIFDGLGEGRVHEVVFLDVKTGDGALNKDQRKVRDCLRAGRVGFVTFEIANTGEARVKRLKPRPIQTPWVHSEDELRGQL